MPFGAGKAFAKGNGECLWCARHPRSETRLVMRMPRIQDHPVQPLDGWRVCSRSAVWRSLAILLMGLGVLCSGRAVVAASAEYPNRSLELIVPWAAGGGSDRVARFLADALQRKLGQPVIVVNRTGGSGAVGHSAGAHAAPDGYTLTLATFELSTLRSMGISQLSWQDFTPLAQVNSDAAALIVRREAPWQTIPELLADIRRQPGRLTLSGTATGGAWDLARSGLLLAAGIPSSQVIWAPTQGSAPALVELLGGHIDLVCCSVPEALAQLEAGPLRVLGVLSPQRLALFPDYPTAREQGIAYDALVWRGLMLPKGAPPAVVQRLNDALETITRSEEFAQFMRKNGFAIEVRTGSDFARFLADQESKWKDVIRGAGYESLGKNHDPGPQALPTALAVALVLALIAEWYFSRRSVLAAGGTPALPDAPQLEEGTDRQPSTQGDAPVASRRTWLLLGALVAYLVCLPRVGFSVSTGVFAFAMMWRLGTRWWVAAPGAVALVAMIHLLFVELFKVQLP